MVYVTLKNPKSIDSKSIETEIRKYVEAGFKTSEIQCILEFIGSDESIQLILNEFRKKVNRIAFEVRPFKVN